MCFPKSNAGDVAREQQQQQQTAINTGLGQIGQAFSGFTPQFYNQRATDYENAALPEFAQQYQNQIGNLMFRLGDQGLLKSSAGRSLGNALSSYATRQRQNIAQAGIGASQDLQRQVAQTQSNLIGQLEASANPAASTQQAIQAAAGFAAPSPIPAIGNLFQDWTNVYGANRNNGLVQSYINRGPASAGMAPVGGSQSIVR